ncbi:hypothetical protein F7R25_37485 [Burkholderia stagnalis]|uniref:Uncharacterized protein n=1 Tax=Burkholderia stagnalis TaxID=1503054 RepID=A0A6L3MJA9_9BURK|nr:hypothetical protein F7R25_37485 [Burkholderia stagnalis]
MHWICTVCKGTTIIPYQDALSDMNGCSSSNVTVKVTHIQCTVCPPVKESGDFNRLKDWSRIAIINT